MTDLRTCSGCKSEILLEYFGMNRKGLPYKTCENCRKKSRKYNKTHKPKGNLYCPVQVRMKRTCQHCKRPYEFDVECETIENHGKILNELSPNRKIPKKLYYFWASYKYDDTFRNNYRKAREKEKEKENIELGEIDELDELIKLFL